MERQKNTAEIWLSYDCRAFSPCMVCMVYVAFSSEELQESWIRICYALIFIGESETGIYVQIYLGKLVRCPCAISNLQQTFSRKAYLVLFKACPTERLFQSQAFKHAC